MTGSLRGDEKKAYVLENLTELLVSKGIKITDEQLNMLIEAAVRELKK